MEIRIDPATLTFRTVPVDPPSESPSPGENAARPREMTAMEVVG